MFRIELLPAAHGDAIWIEYGDAKRPRRVVIDGGPAPTYEKGLFERLRMLPNNGRIDLFVVTHIDADHIDGAIILLQQAADRIDEVWFNDLSQLPTEKAETFQPIQGEFLSALLDTPKIRGRWNTRAGGSAIMIPEKGPLPVWELPDNARLTLLSPGFQQTRRLRSRWNSAIRDFSPGDREEALRRLKARGEYRPPPFPAVFGGDRMFGDDRSVANGSSIAFLLEHDGVCCLFAGDAHARVLSSSLREVVAARNAGRGGPLRLDAVKLPHHGSLSNVSDELLGLIECSNWLVSTNGAIFGHPNIETAQLVARHSPDARFLCNYKSVTTVQFADRGARPRWSTGYPGDGATAGPAGGILLDLTPRVRRKPAPGKRAARRRKAQR
jgi:beta-lactamase superfamily II metal-dependent hydrolase